jgi:hypothetical protein
MEPPVPPPPRLESELAPVTTLGARLLNVFATPGEVFNEVATRPPCTGNWLVPVMLSCVVAVVSVLVIFSQDTIRHQVQEQQARAIERKLRELPQEQRDQARAAIERFSSPTVLKIGGSVSAVFSTFGWLFFTALVIWLLGRFGFKGRFTFVQALETCGLASMVNLLGAVVATLLMVGMGNLYATPGPALFIRDFDPARKLHLVLAACNVFTFWYLATLAIGLAKLSRTSALRTFPCLFLLWAAVRLGLIWLTAGYSG